MKKSYVMPEMMMEEFVANEYVSVCYHFNCSPGYSNKTLWADSNRRNELGKITQGCDGKHLVPGDEYGVGYTTNGVENGMKNVFYFQDENGNYHVTAARPNECKGDPKPGHGHGPGPGGREEHNRNMAS